MLVCRARNGQFGRERRFFFERRRWLRLRRGRRRRRLDDRRDDDRIQFVVESLDDAFEIFVRRQQRVNEFVFFQRFEFFAEGEIGIREKSRGLIPIREAVEITPDPPPYLYRNKDEMQGTLSRLPERGEIPLPVAVEERLIVEFYS